MSKLSNFGALDYLRRGAERAIKQLYESYDRDPNEVDIDTVKFTVFRARDAAQNIVKSFQEDIENFDFHDNDSIKALRQTLEDIMQISEFEAKYSEEDQQALIDEVTQEVDQFQIIMEEDDFVILVQAATFAVEAIKNERFFYDIFGDKLLNDDVESTKQNDAHLDSIPEASPEELRALQEETAEERLECAISEISTISNSDQIEVAAFKTIDLALIVKSQTDDAKVTRAADAIMILSTKEFNEYKGYDDYKTRDPFKMFDVVNDLINDLPDGIYKRALMAAFTVHIALATLKNSEDLIKLRASVLNDMIDKTVVSVSELELTLLENLSNPNETQELERKMEIRSVYKNAKQLKEVLKNYKQDATDFYIDIELVKLAQDTIDNASKVCKQALSKTRSLSAPDPRPRNSSNASSGNKIRRKQ